MTTTLTTSEDNKALAAVPEHLRGLVGNRAGLEDVGREDVLIPRLCVAQALSPQINKKKDNYIPDLEVGQMFNSVTGEIYDEAIKVVPLFFFRQFIHFKPIDEGGGIVAMYDHVSQIPADQTYKLGPTGEKPSITEFKNVMSLLVKSPGVFEPIVISFKSSGLKEAKRWVSLMTMANVPAYAKYYELTSVAKSNGTNDWEALKVAPEEFVEPELFIAAENYFTQLRAKGVKVDTSGLAPDDSATTIDADGTAF